MICKQQNSTFLFRRAPKSAGMATILPSPGQEQELDEDAEKLRTALSAWARQAKFEKRPENVEECVDRKQTAPFIRKIGLQKV